jgi:hypothetical protein
MMEPREEPCRRTGTAPWRIGSGKPPPVGAAPAGEARNLALGRPREPIGLYYGRSAGSLLDWDWAKMPSSQETRTRGTEIAAMEHREAPAFSKRERGETEEGSAAWRSIPSAFCRGGEKAPTKTGGDGAPGAAKNTGDGASLRGCLKFESGNGRTRA